MGAHLEAEASPLAHHAEQPQRAHHGQEVAQKHVGRGLHGVMSKGQGTAHTPCIQDVIATQLPCNHLKAMAMGCKSGHGD